LTTELRLTERVKNDLERLWLGDGRRRDEGTEKIWNLGRFKKTTTRTRVDVGYNQCSLRSCRLQPM
jgi:hypothetical protein